MGIKHSEMCSSVCQLTEIEIIVFIVVEHMQIKVKEKQSWKWIGN
jgi:hypothetical protein